jgi:glycosyltransferase involved in cell wall biosynthesis
LFFGFIRKYKGLDILFESISILKKSNYLKGQIKFLIAGEFYEDRKSYDELMAKLGIEDELILRTDFIPDSEVKNYLCAADVVIQPYRSATQSGVTPLAYHFEVPMIVTNVGGLPALVPHEKVGLVSEPDALSISNTIQQFFAENPNRFLPGLVEEKKKYSWDVMANEIMSS